MTDDHNPLASNRGMTFQDLKTLKKQRTALRKRKRDLEGAKAYLGNRAEPELLTELEDVSQKLQEIEKRIADMPVTTSEYREPMDVDMGGGDTGEIAMANRIHVHLDNREVDYVSLEEAGTLELHSSGPTPTLNDFCVLNLELNLLINDVAFFLIRDFVDPGFLRELENAGFPLRVKYPTSRGYSPDRLFPYTRNPLVSTRINTIRVGSFDEILSFTILPLLAHPDVRSVLQNLVANVVWLLGTNLGTVIKGKLVKPNLAVPQVEIGSNLRDVLISRGEPFQIEFVHDIPNQGTTRFILQTGYSLPLITATTTAKPPQLPLSSNSPE